MVYLESRVAQKGSLVKVPVGSSLRGLDLGSPLYKEKDKTSKTISFR